MQPTYIPATRQPWPDLINAPVSYLCICQITLGTDKHTNTIILVFSYILQSLPFLGVDRYETGQHASNCRLGHSFVHFWHAPL